MNYIYTLEDPRKLGVIRYVGKTSRTLEIRLRDHLCHLKRNNHRTNWIKSLLVDGVKPIITSIFSWDDPALEWQFVEQAFIRIIREEGHPLINAHTGGTGTELNTTWTVSEAGRANMSAAAKGRKFTAEHCANISAGQKGRKMSDAAKAKIKLARARQTFSAETREKWRAARLGVKRPAEVCANMSAAMKGKTKTPEHCAAISAAKSGKKINRIASGEERAATSERNRNRVWSAESRAKASAAAKLRYAKVALSLAA